MTEGSRKVFNFLKENYGEKLTNADIATSLGLTGPTVVGSVNGLVKKGYATREEVTIPATEEGGKDMKVKYISLTEEGMSFDPDAEAKKD